MTTATRTLVLTFVLAAGVLLAACGSDRPGATVPAHLAAPRGRDCGAC